MYYYTEEDDNVFRAEQAARERKTKEEDEIKRLKAEIETLERKLYEEGESLLALNHQLLTVRAETIKECLNKVMAFCAKVHLFNDVTDEMLLFNHLDALKMQAMLDANEMAGE